MVSSQAMVRLLSTVLPVVMAAAAVGCASSTTAEAERAGLTIDAPRRLRLAGFALNATDPLVFVTRLKDADIFRDVFLERSADDSRDDVPRYRFDVVCEW